MEQRILIGNGLLDRAGEELMKIKTAGKAAVISDETVFPLYGERLMASLKAAGFKTVSHTVPAGESSKDLLHFAELLNFLAEEGFSRTDTVIALGGGVIGDLAGFAAASYLRGIDIVQIPTTLLSMTDSAVGGKTAVDLPAGKNLAGAFHMPLCVLCDPTLADTLPEREYRSGMGEIIKYAMIAGDPALTKLLQAGRKAMDLRAVAEHCLAFKMKAVEEDPYDRGIRRILNFGHTFGHAIEAEAGYSLSHGEAVAKGMGIMFRSAVKRGLCEAEAAHIFEELAALYELDLKVDAPASILAKRALHDKKIAGGKVNLIVPAAPGEVRILPEDPERLTGWLKDGGVR